MGHGSWDRGSMTHLGFTIVTRWGVSGGGIIWAGCKVGHGSSGSGGFLGSVTRSWVHECDPVGSVRRGDLDFK